MNLVTKRMFINTLFPTAVHVNIAEVYISPIQYFVWKRWGVIRTQFGRINFNVIRTETNYFKESNLIDGMQTDGVRVESIPRIRDVGHPRNNSKFCGMFEII